MMSLKKITLVTLALLVMTACSKSADTASAGSTEVADRQALMKDWRAASDILKGMTENPANFDAADVKEQAKFLADGSAKMWTYFGDANAKGEATDAVWSDAAGFKAATENFNAAVAELNTVAQTATQVSDIEAALGKVGESCGSCHKVYKK